MITRRWIVMTEAERSMVADALVSLQRADPGRSAEIELLHTKLSKAEAYPLITVGVFGGQVQWVMGNPFPIRICDYDGEAEELQDVDDEAQKCRLWFEPADGAAQS